MSKQRLLSDGLPHLFCRNVILRPLENKHSVWLQDAHTLCKTVVQHLRPVFVQLSVLFDQPRCFLCTSQVRWVKHNQRKGAVREWKVREVTENIGVYAQWAVSGVLPKVAVFLPPPVAIHSSGMVLIKPDCAGTAGDIQYFFLQSLSLLWLPAIGQPSLSAVLEHRHFAMGLST